jgi:hypothetical protein
MFPGEDGGCSYCPLNRTLGFEDVQCSTFMDGQLRVITYDTQKTSGKYSLDWLYQADMWLQYSINVSNTQNIYLVLSHNVELDYDFILVALEYKDANDCSGYTMRGYDQCFNEKLTYRGQNISLNSSTGYVSIVLASDTWNQHEDPVSFSWTASCKPGFYDAGNSRCEQGCSIADGKFLNVTTGKCSFCKVCQPGQKVTRLCTANQDTACAACVDCPPGIILTMNAFVSTVAFMSWQLAHTHTRC